MNELTIGRVVLVLDPERNQFRPPSYPSQEEIRLSEEFTKERDKVKELEAALSAEIGKRLDADKLAVVLRDEVAVLKKQLAEAVKPKLRFPQPNDTCVLETPLPEELNKDLNFKVGTCITLPPDYNTPQQEIFLIWQSGPLPGDPKWALPAKHFKLVKEESPF